MSTQKNKFKISLRIVNYIFIFAIIVCCSLLAINTIRTNSYNKKIMDISEAYIEYTDTANQLELGSDILTEQARLFAETGDIGYLNAYFEESNISKHRDVAIQKLDALPHVNAEENLKKAMDESLKLMEREYYAMRLTSVAYKIPEEVLPDEIRSVTLTEDDLALSSDEMKQKARILLFDRTYQNTKRQIKRNVNAFIDGIMRISMSENKDISGKLKRNLFLQFIFILLVLFIIILIAVLVNSFIIIPMIRLSKNIKKNLAINMPSYLLEMQALNESYNNLRNHNNELMDKLTLMAHKDALTGIGSRFAYNKYVDNIVNKEIPVLLFVFDVNNLRSTNNNEGHIQGDKLLMDSARSIKNVFGKYDYENCFRVGGDEFVAFIENEPESRAHYYLTKFAEETKINNVELSVGYAYTDNITGESIKNMFNKADADMYKAKYGADKE